MTTNYERFLIRRETVGRPLLEAIRHAATARGLHLPGVNESASVGRDVILLHRGGHADINRADDGTIDIAIWRAGALVAGGRTDDVEAVAELLSRISAGYSPEVATPPFLTMFDEAGSPAEFETRWRWLLDYETDERSQSIIQAAGAEALLRAQRPSAGGHTTLALSNGHFRRQTHTIQFYPAQTDEWHVSAWRPSHPDESGFRHTYGLSLADAVAAAVDEVTEHWLEPTESTGPYV